MLTIIVEWFQPDGVSEYFWIVVILFYNDMVNKVTLQVLVTFQNQWKTNVYIIYHAKTTE